MLVVIVEFVGLLILNEKCRKRHLFLNPYLLMALSIQFIILLGFRGELSLMGRDVYFSDAEGYWMQTLDALNGVPLSVLGSQFGYVLTSLIIQRTSPFIWVGWNNLSNLLLFDLSVFLVIEAVSKYKRINAKSFVQCVLWNPLAIYGIMRNLKDAQFIFCVAVMMNCYIHFTQKKDWKYLFIGIAVDVFVSSIRPWGFLVLPVMFVFGGLYDLSKVKMTGSTVIKIVFSAAAAVAIVLVVFQRFNLFAYLKLWVPIVIGNALNRSPIQILLAPLRLYTGPGIYRAFFGEEYFMYNMRIASICAGIGCVIWWFWFSMFITNLKRLRINRTGFALIGCMLLFVGMYSMQYGGSVEHRMRGTLYFMTTAAVLSSSEKRLPITASAILCFFIIAICATVFSI